MITIERIKAALSALKPEVKKPWVTLDHLPYIHATDDPDAKPYSTPVVGRFDCLESADYIMACNPAAMAEVLAHIDAQAAEIARLRAAPATAPEKTVQEIMEFARHYAANTFSSATLEDKIRRSLETPATAPEPVAWLAHYVGRSGVEQEYVSTDKTLADENDASGKARPLYLHPPATAPEPSWHDAPTVPGLWACRQFITDRVQAYEVTDEIAFNKNLGLKGRWYGPIPPDGDKP